MTFSVKMSLFAFPNKFPLNQSFSEVLPPLISGQKSKMRTKKFRKCGQKCLSGKKAIS